MRQLVIITHRYHYHICQVAILLAIKQFNPDKIAIFFDDIIGTRNGWQELGKQLLTDMRRMYNFKFGDIYALPFSSLRNVHNEPSGWIRQQYVKLNLHRLLPGDEWLVIDGDVLINHPIDPWNYCYVNLGDPLRPHHDLFVRYALDLDQQRVMHSDIPVEFSGVPIRLLTRKTLEGLEKHIYDLHGTDVQGIRNSFTLRQGIEKYLELSEYDLIGNYQHFVSKDLLPLQNLRIFFHSRFEILEKWDNLKEHITVLHGWDDLPVEWYQQFGITINKEIWDILYSVKE